jgi:hypothetical protein
MGVVRYAKPVFVASLGAPAAVRISGRCGWFEHTPIPVGDRRGDCFVPAISEALSPRSERLSDCMPLPGASSWSGY